MKIKFINQKNKVVFFKKWQNKSYSIFSSLGKYVIISVLPVIYVLLFHLPVLAQSDTLKLDEIIINSKRQPKLFSESARVVKLITKEEISNAPVQSVEDILEYALGVDIRQRGAFGVQSDVSIRGGSNEQVLILINGVKINDVQTGHHSLNIPVDIENIERLEILEGPGARFYGQNAFSGAINIITHQNRNNSVKANFTYGQHNYMRGSIATSFNLKKFSNYLSVSKKYCKGYTENTDFDITNIFYQTSTYIRAATISLQSGFLYKEFGANTFYTPKYPNQYEAINSSFVSLQTEIETMKFTVIPTIYWRRHQDRFELFRETDNWYEKKNNYWIRNNSDTAKYVPGIYQAWNYYSGHNYHVTNVYGAEINSYFYSKIGKTSFGVEFRSENILSNKLGIDTVNIPVLFEKEQFYNLSKSRNNVSGHVEHSLSFWRFNLATGIFVNWNSDFKWNYYSGIDLSFDLSRKAKIFASVNQSMRMPTFTDLYYQGPSNIGNIELEPEEAISYETGVKYTNNFFSSHISVFWRNGKNIIDWVKETEEQAKWQTMNYTELNTFGAEVSGKLLLNNIFCKKFFIQTIDMNYMYINIDKQEQEFLSKYIYDYLIHNASLSVSHYIYKGVGASWRISFQDRAGTFNKYDFETGIATETEYKPTTLIDARVFWNYKFFTIYFEGSNLLGTKYYDINNIEMPRSWFKGGVKINIK